MNDLRTNTVFTSMEKETIEEYAARWAAKFFDTMGAVDLQDVAWSWAKDDKNSPVYEAIHTAGEPVKVVGDRFYDAFQGMKSVLKRFNETTKVNFD
jgi:hypothetical protein